MTNGSIHEKLLVHAGNNSLVNYCLQFNGMPTPVPTQKKSTKEKETKERHKKIACLW
uniref:Uncharacterized protein n=1 Tax=Rhizophora mucronata TaxID=61149 RepID=A0A2P2IJ82_RHIMU